MSEERLVSKMAEINGAISKIWREVGALKGADLNFYKHKNIRKAKGGILFIGTIADVFKRDSTVDRFVNRDSERSNYRKEFFSQVRLLARQVGSRGEWAYIDFWLGLRTKRREFNAAKTTEEKAAANLDFVRKVEELSFNLLRIVIGELKPKCIVVFWKASNFLAGKVKSTRRATISSYAFEKKGFHLWDGKIPVFLCWSISRCASGDMCYERLRWHIKKAMERDSYGNARG